SVHEKILRALLARLGNDPARAVLHAFDARQAAEARAYGAFHCYASALEACGRLGMGERHSGNLLGTTGVRARRTLQGSEYGLHTRVLCWEALRKAGSPQAEEARRRASEYVRKLLGYIRDPGFQQSFVRRTMVAEVLGKGTAMSIPSPG